MPWSSATLRDNFQTVIKSLHAFRGEFRKPKNAKGFDMASAACQLALDILYREEMPEGADQFISNLGGAINTALTTIRDEKEGLQKKELFYKSLSNLEDYVSTFKKTGGAEVAEKIKLQKEKEKKESETHNLLEFEMEPIEVKVIKKEDVNPIEVRLLPKEELERLIKEIGEDVFKNVSELSMFKHAVNHAFKYYPKTMISGVGGFTLGTSFMLLYKANELFGEAANEWLQSTTGLPIRVEYAVPGVIAAVGFMQSLVAVSNSKPKRPKPETEEMQHSEPRRDGYMRLGQ